MTNLVPVSSLSEMDGEPRISDIRLAELLGFNRATSIRVSIQRASAELALHGVLHQTDAKSKDHLGRGRPGKAYWLNEGQALVICALSRTDKAAQVRKAVIDVFMAYRRGQLVDVSAHYRRPPAKPDHSEPAPLTTRFQLTQFYPDGMAHIYIAVPMQRITPIVQAYEQIRH